LNGDEIGGAGRRKVARSHAREVCAADLIALAFGHDTQFSAGPHSRVGDSATLPLYDVGAEKPRPTEPLPAYWLAIAIEASRAVDPEPVHRTTKDAGVGLDRVLKP
jgi:hypothetical protein